MSRSASLAIATLLAVAATAAAARDLPGPRQIGEEVEHAAFSPAVPAMGRTAEPRLVWSEVLQHPGATYIAPHFSRFSLPKGAFVVVRDPMGTRQWTYDGVGKEGADGKFWGLHVYGESAVIELWSRRALPADAVAIDRYARGFNEWEMPDWHPGIGSPAKALCGSDDSQWAKCYQTSEATAYSKSRAAARLLINGTSACTGWLVGNAGHLMTNEHCISTASSASNTNFEFMAEGATCSTSCASWGACPGTVVATSSTLIKLNASLDYALVQLPTNPTATYGYFKMRDTGATLGERIYIPQHPAHWGKKIAMTAGAANATVSSLSEPPCSGSGYNDVGYSADTQGGSSGSAVVGYSDHAVVALHHCAGSGGSCPNRGVPIQRVITDLGSSLPPDSTTSGGGGGGGTELIVNGGFESGTSPWVFSGQAFRSTGSYPKSGVAYSYLGNTNNASGQEYQQITIPSSATGTLTFWLNVTSSETTTTTQYDKLFVEVRNTAGTLLATLATYSNLNKATAGVYTQRTHSVAAYKGQTVRIQFRATTDSSLISTFRIDDVSVK